MLSEFILINDQYAFWISEETFYEWNDSGLINEI